MQIYTGAQIKNWDVYTIEHEPIRSIDLMERAANAIAEAVAERWEKNRPIVALAGPGNNGGDALAVARLLAERGYSVEAFLFNVSGRLSDDCDTNRQRLHATKKAKNFIEVSDSFTAPQLDASTIVIDGLFGSGINKPLAGGFASLVKFVNASSATVVSIDMPSGLMTEDNTYNNRQAIVRADLTLTLGQRKLAMYLAGNEEFTGEIETLDIGLSKEFQQRFKSVYSITDEADIRRIMRPRPPFAHKGTMGHALIIAGSYGMAGAALLATRAALRSGVGKATVHSPKCNCVTLQTAVPEAVMSLDSDEKIYSDVINVDDFDAVAIGPGIGRDETTAITVMSQLQRIQCPIVLDADAINILSTHRPWISQLPKGLVLTPHPAEFDRLTGTPASSSFDRLTKASDLAVRLASYIILKGRYTAVCCPDGDIALNPTGNAGMATAGSGDVLTGIVAALLARGYGKREACLAAVYLHGLAGDIAACETGQESLIASDIIDRLPRAFARLFSFETKQ